MARLRRGYTGPVGQILDGQIQNQNVTVPECPPPTTMYMSEVPHVTVISDGQPQAPKVKRSYLYQPPTDEEWEEYLNPILKNCIDMLDAKNLTDLENCLYTGRVVAAAMAGVVADNVEEGPSGQVEVDVPTMSCPCGEDRADAPTPCPCSQEVPTQAPKVRRDASGPANQIPDGQVQNKETSSSYGQEVPHVTAISDGQPQAPKARPGVPGAVNQISDGQVQNTEAATACSREVPQATTTGEEFSQVTAIGDGQPQAPKAKRYTNFEQDLREDCIKMGARTGPDMAKCLCRGHLNSRRDDNGPVNQISDGQVQNQETTTSCGPELPHVTAISDGQPQAPKMARRNFKYFFVPSNDTREMEEYYTAACIKMGARTVDDFRRCISTGNVRRDIMDPVGQIPDGQIQNQGGTSQSTTSTETSCSSEVPHVTAIGDGQPQAPKFAAKPKNHATGGGPGGGHPQLANAILSRFKARTAYDVMPSPNPPIIGMPPPGSGFKARSVAADDDAPVRYTCASASALRMTLADGVLKDGQGRTGYIAGNRQFQFDAPPQAGAIVTAGFSVCQDGRIALGDQTTWFQCSSGDFYNLYDSNWAPQCEPVAFYTVALQDC